MTERIKLITGLVESLKNRGPFAASTDRGGTLLSNNNRVLELYGEVATTLGLPLPLLEVLQFLGSSDYDEVNQIAGMHGKIGASKFSDAHTTSMVLDTAKSKILNPMLRPHTNTLEKAGYYGVINQEPMYTVFHTQFISGLKPHQITRIADIQNAKHNTLKDGSPAFIMAVENGVEAKALEKVKDLPHKLEQQGVTAIRLLDLCHIMRFLELETQHGYTDRSMYIAAWKKMIKILESFAHEPLLLHMPIGTLVSDSLLQKYIDQIMINDALQVVLNVPFFMTIENQSNGRGLFHDNPVKNIREYDRLMPMFEMLYKAGAFQQPQTV